MEKTQLVERAKIYLQMLSKGVHPVTGIEIPSDSALADEKVKNCFAFIIQTLDEYLELTEKVRVLEEEKEENTIIVAKKSEFSITREQCERIALSSEPIPIISFMKNVNSVINADEMEKLSSTRITKWLTNRGLIATGKVPTVVNKTVYKPSETAAKIGIIEEQTVDKTSGEIKTRIALEKSAQLFILENIEDIIKTT